MKTPSFKFLILLSRVGVFAPVLALLTLFAQIESGQAAPVIVNVVESNGDNEATDTITAKWTGQTFPCTIANEPVPGITVGTPFTVPAFGNYSPCYVDRNHRYTNADPASIPSYLRGKEYIMSGNDNRDNATYRLDVTVSTAVQVYLLIDNRLSDANNANPPTLDATHMQWVLDQGWVPVTTGANRANNPALPDEVAIDEGADNTINNHFSVYTKKFLAGTFSLFQADNTGQNMYGIVVAPFSPGSYESAVLADGPIAYWRFDYGTPTTAVNIGSLGAAANASYSNGAARGPQAPHSPAFVGFEADNTAAQLDGVDDFLQSITGLVNGPNVTMSGWIRRQGPQRGRTGLLGQDNVIEFGYIDNNTLQLWVDNFDAANEHIDVATPFPNSEWEHVAVVVDGAALTIATYTNGQVAGVGVVRNTTYNFDGNVNPFVIGGNAFGGGVSFNGQMDEVAVYDKALTAAQIATQYRAAFKLSTKTNVFAPGDPIQLVNGVNDGDGNAGPPPGAEGVEHAIDRVTQKYLNFLDLGSGFATTPSLGPTIVQCLRFYTANDATERDPASYTLEGSVSGLGGPWVAISSGSLALPLDRNPGGTDPVANAINPATRFNQLVEFPNNTPYTSYRVTFPTLRNAAAANSMQIAEVELLGAAFPAAPRVVTQPNDATVPEGHTATFIALGDGSAPLSYQWFRKLASEASFSPIAGAISASYTTPVLVFPDDNNSQFKVQVSNSFGSVDSRAAILTVQDDVTAPTIVAASGSPDFAHASLVFSEELETGIALDTFNYTIDGGLTVLGAALSANGRSVTLATTPQAPDTVYTITVNNVQDLAGNAIAPDSTKSFRSFITGPCNGVRFEAYDTSSTPGNTVNLLTSHPNFPNNPRDVANIARLDSRLAYPDDSHEQYGGRMRGVFFPISSGAHIFFLAADDNAELWLSTDASPANKVRIATETSWSGTKEWTSSQGGSSVPNKRSAPLNLVGGQAYYIEALYKEGGGGDHCSVAVQQPGDAGPPANGGGDIPSSMLGESAPANFLGPVVLNPALPADVSATAGTLVSFSVGATRPADFATICFQWQRDSNDGNGFQSIMGANSTTYSFGPVSVSDNGSKFRCLVSSFATAATSREALLAVMVDTNPPVCQSITVLPDLTRLDIRFSEFVDATTAQDPFNYTVDGVNPPGVVLRPDGVTVRVTLAAAVAPASQVCISIQNVTDLAGNVINPNPSTKCIDTPIFSCGLLRWEAWNNIGGTAVDALLNDPRYPDSPDETRIFGSFDTVTELGTSNLRESFGARVVGLFIPPSSGNWVFYLASDDASRLFLNPLGTDSGGKQMIAEETGCCNNLSAIHSAPIPLTAGGRYYIEGVYKEAGGGDHIFVAARLEGQPAPSCSAGVPCAEALRGDRIGIYADGQGVTLDITQNPADAKVCRDPSVATPPTATFSVAATAQKGGAAAPVVIQWQRNNGGGYVDIPFARSATYSFTPTLADSGARFRALVATPGAPCQVSYEATLTVVQINTAPRFTGGPAQNVACGAGAQTVPSWASGILPHSIARVPTVYANNFESGPAGMTLAGNAAISGGNLKLTTPINSIYGAGSIAAPVQTYESVQVTWKSYLGDGNAGADGYSFNLGEDVVADPGYGGEEGTGTGLIVAVDTFDNGAALDPCGTGVELKWRGAPLTCTNIPKDNLGDGRFLRKSQFVDASVSVDATGLATFTYDGNTIQAQIPAYAGVRASRALFWARTGGANDNQWIDDFNLQAFPFDSSSVEAGQTVNFLVSNDNPGLFAQQPAVSPDGTLTYTPAPGACGTARITVVAKDNGGTDPQCGGRDASDPYSVNITVAPCPPRITCPADITARCTGTNTPVTYTVTASDCSGNSLPVVCFPPSGSGFPEGTTPVTCTATDSGGQSATCTFRVIVSCNQCPAALAKASPNAELHPNQTSTIIISANNSNACVTLDGSMSSDADGDTLTYVWLADLDGNGSKEPFASGAVVNYCFELGTHDITLVVDDGRCTASVSLTVEVLSGCEAVEVLIDKIDNADLGRRNKRPLIATLKAACASFDRGSCTSAVNQLHAFQNKVRAQVGHEDAALADEIIALTQEIIDAIDCEQGNGGSGDEQ